MRKFAPILIALSVLTGCERGVLVPSLALPAPGNPVPTFDFPMLRGGDVNPELLRGQPTLLALWATDCSASREALARIETMHKRYAAQGIRVIILADDDDRERLTAFVDSAGIQSTVAIASGKLEKIFGGGQRNSAENDTIVERLERNIGRRTRVAFGLPSFLVLDATGTIAYRSAGVPLTKETPWDVDAALEKMAKANPLTQSAVEARARQ